MPREGQKTVTLSEATYVEVVRLVERNPELFDSTSQFVKHAIADLIVKTRSGSK